MKKTFKIPEEFQINVKEISNNVYEIELLDKQKRKVVAQGENLEIMINKAVNDLKKIRKGKSKKLK